MKPISPERKASVLAKLQSPYNMTVFEDAKAAIAAGFVGFTRHLIVDRVSYEYPLTEQIFAFAAGRNLPLSTYIVLDGCAPLIG